MESGIYQILNKLNYKTYIGSSVSLHRRKLQHFNRLRNGKHCNKYLQNAIRKQGLENFKFLILEHCEVDKLSEREQFWINFIKPEYNLAKDARGRFDGFNHSIDAKVKMKRAMKQRIDKGNFNYPIPRKKVAKYDKNHTFIAEYQSLTEAAISIGKNSTSKISNVCKNKRKTAYGFIWKYV